MKVHLGCGPRLMDAGWVNIDPRQMDIPDGYYFQQGDALNTRLAENSVDILFSNAMLEHVYGGQQLPLLKHWRSILTDTGKAVAIGIPDFETVARCYVERAEGVTGPTFDLMEAYRYTIGFPEGHLLDTHFDFREWDVTDRGDVAPPVYLMQIHKMIFDADAVARLCLRAGLVPTVFRYAYQDEPHPLNLGFLAGRSHHPLSELSDVPIIDEFVNFDTLEEVPATNESRLAGVLARYYP